LTAQIPGLTGEQIGALEMLADFPHGCTEGQGLHDRVARRIDTPDSRTATPGIVEAGGRSLGMARLAITEKGRTIVR
jgi:hypothetical protein